MSFISSHSHSLGTHASSTLSSTYSKSVSRPPCADRPDDWDLDMGTLDSWRAAVSVCENCPLLAGCADLAQTLIERGAAPRALIWAGVAYDSAGRVVEHLERYRSTSMVDRRPIRIVHNVTRPAGAGNGRFGTGSIPSAPRRLFVLGSRELRPTGTEGVGASFPDSAEYPGGA